MYYLPELSAVIKETRKESAKFLEEDIDAILFERNAQVHGGEFLQYLMQCFKSSLEQNDQVNSL